MRRPNILLCITDQQRWDALGAIGANPDIKTPHLDALAAQSVVFDHYFVQSPVCMPSRVSFLTGQYPGTLGITQMGVPVPLDTVTLPQMLKNFGYRSANLGKLHFLPHANHNHREMHPAYGFDQLEISDEPGCYEDAYFAWVKQKSPQSLDKISCGLPPARADWNRVMGAGDGVIHPESGREEWTPRAFAAGDDLTHSAFVCERTVDYLHAAAHRPHDPFLLIAGFYSPHSPWIAPQKYYDLYDPATFMLPPRETWGERTEEMLRAARHGYYAMISEVDAHIGHILSVLEETNQAENTIVVFTSDHGEWLGTHGRFGKGYPADDAVSRVPFLLRVPSAMQAAHHAAPRRENRIVEAVDLVPTLLDLCGIGLPPPLQGRSLAGPPATETDAPPASALTEMNDWKALRTPGFRYLLHADGREKLHDLSVDPWEMHDVASDAVYAETLAAHRLWLLRRLLSRERPLSRTWPY